MLVADMDLGRRFVALKKTAGKQLLCAVTGAHHYGFPSADSDIDLKGIHLAPTEDFLGLREVSETRDCLEIFEQTECDYTSHEAKKALRLLLAGNGNILERILSPMQLYPTEALDQLRALALGALSKKFAKHYLGYFKGMCAEHEKNERPKAKPLLYSFRVALTGTHLMKTGALLADLNETARIYDFKEVAHLIAFKKENREKSVISEDLNKALKKKWPKLEAQLREAAEQSFLPEAPTNEDAVSSWLCAQRLAQLSN